MFRHQFLVHFSRQLSLSIVFIHISIVYWKTDIMETTDSQTTTATIRTAVASPSCSSESVTTSTSTVANTTVGSCSKPMRGCVTTGERDILALKRMAYYVEEEHSTRKISEGPWHNLRVCSWTDPRQLLQIKIRRLNFKMVVLRISNRWRNYSRSSHIWYLFSKWKSSVGIHPIDPLQLLLPVRKMSQPYRIEKVLWKFFKI